MKTKIVRSAAERGDAHTGWQSNDASPKLNTRIRRVFPTAEVPHKWAHQTQAEARNPQGNLFFEGATLYSYRHSYPIARIYRRAEHALVLIQENHYSGTTAGHIWAAKRAASHMRRADVPCVNADSTEAHALNLAFLEKGMQEAARKAGRRTTEDAVYRDAAAASALHKDLADYLTFFRIRRKMPPMPRFAAAFERARRIENPDPTSKDKRERAKAARRAKLETARTLAVGAARSNWRLFGAFGNIEVPRLPHERYGTSRIGPCMLRVNGDRIETSQGARVPLAAAPMVWRNVQYARAHGSYVAGSRRFTIGDYPLDRIDADGTLHAGCHTIPYSELASMARQLGLAS
jgi:hypothetical protein